MRLLTDTHCHLNLDIFKPEMPEILNRARDRGISRILVPGIDLETSRAAVALAEQYPEIYAAVGMHPHDASTWDESTQEALHALAGHDRVVAIGEIGLDYYRDRSPRPIQREVFRAQLRLAAEMKLPVVIHNREALDDLWSELSVWQKDLDRQGLPLAGRPGVLHSYDGALSTAQEAIETGFFIGISGPVTFKNALERQAVVAGLPLDHILIETDAPYLTPHPYRGRRNEPAYVALVAEKVAELQAIPLETVLQATWKNAAQLFNWGADH